MESLWASSPRQARSAFVPIAFTIFVSSLVGGTGLGSRPSPYALPSRSAARRRTRRWGGHTDGRARGA